MNKGKRILIEEEEDEEPILVEDTAIPNDNTVSMCLLGKLWTNRSFNTFGLMETMKKVWGPSQGVNCRELGHNLISFQFKTKRDMKRVLAMEPWHFNKHVLVLKQFTGDAQPSAMKFDSTPFWIRVYDLPMLGRDEKILKQIGARFGEVLEIDRESMMGMSRSVRIKIMLKLERALKRGTKIKIGNAEPCWIPVSYERLPSFCYSCGKLGHTYKDCLQTADNGDEERGVDEEALPYGDWMRASPMKTMQNMSERSGRENDRVRQVLFNPDNTSSIQTKNERKEEQKLEDERKSNKQVHDLLSSFERVEVSERTGKISSMNHAEGWNKEPFINPTLSQTKTLSTNHPTTKTDIATPPDPLPRPAKPDSKGMTNLIPLCELVKMVNPSLKTNNPPTFKTTINTSQENLNPITKIPEKKIPPNLNPNIPGSHGQDNPISITEITLENTPKPTNPDLLTNPKHHPRKEPVTTTSLPKRPTPKLESLLKTIKIEKSHEEIQEKSKQGKWKRKEQNHRCEGSGENIMGVKRSIDSMEIEEIGNTEAKRTRVEEIVFKNKTVETAAQPRRAL